MENGYRKGGRSHALNSLPAVCFLSRNPSTRVSGLYIPLESTAAYV